MDKKYLVSVLLYFISGVLAISLIVFVVYHLAGMDSTEYTTAAATRVKADLGFDCDAYLFRDEQPLSFSGAGMAYSTLRDGENVRVGGELCGVYASNPELLAELKKVDRLVAIMTSAQQGQPLFEANAEVRGAMRALRELNANGSAVGSSVLTDELTAALGRRSASAGERIDYEYEIGLLEIRRRALIAQLGEKLQTVTAPVSGNYSGVCDGYEEYFSFDKAEDLDPLSFEKLIASPVRADLTQSAGKISRGASWRLVTETDAENAVPLVAGRSYTVRFDGGEEIGMTLERISTDPTRGVALLTFTSRVALRTDVGRCARVKVISGTVEGLMIPNGALRFVDVGDGEGNVEGQTSVYVLRGNKIVRKRVEIVKTEEGCCIVADYTDDKEHPGYLSLNDKVITSGSGIKEGYAQ